MSHSRYSVRTLYSVDIFTIQRGLASSPPIASDFCHTVAPNPSRYSVMSSSIFLPKPISLFLAIKKGKLGLEKGEFSGRVLGRLSSPKRELLGCKHPRAQNVGEGRLAEEGDEGGEDAASLRFVSLLFPSLIFSLLMVVFPLP